MHFSRVILFAAIIALTGCLDSSVVTITNQSSVTVSNVVLSGSGFSNRFESIAPGAERHFTVRPRGESGLRVAFDAARRIVDSGKQGYFEADGYRVSAVIGTNLSVSVSSDL
jgi:uncharacterized lipoprotein YajG